MGNKKRFVQNVKINHVGSGHINIARHDVKQNSHSVNTGGGKYIENLSLDTGGGDFIGRDQVNSGINVEEVNRLFEAIYKKIDTLKTINLQDKEDLKNDIKEVNAEAIKGEQANEDFLTRRLRNIKRMAPDILEVVLAALANPLAGFGMVVRKVVEKLKEDADSKKAHESE